MKIPENHRENDCNLTMATLETDSKSSIQKDTTTSIASEDKKEQAKVQPRENGTKGRTRSKRRRTYKPGGGMPHRGRNWGKPQRKNKK